MFLIRPEGKEDYKNIFEVNLLAFGRDGESKLIGIIRESESYVEGLSLVAVSNNNVVSHILFSRIIIGSDTEAIPALALAPMAVKPQFQNHGIGSMLVKDGLKKCKELGHKIVVVLGHSNYYPRFGFIPAKTKGIKPPFPVSDESFMVLELTEGALNGIKGVVKYPPQFDVV